MKKLYDPIEERIAALTCAQVKNVRLLDVGTGKGYLAIHAVKYCGCEVVSFDADPAQIALAKEQALAEGVENKIAFMCADARNIPFLEKSFHTVASFNALHHCGEHIADIVLEMLRVAQHKIFITELHKEGARIFDEQIYPERNHREMCVDLDYVWSLLEPHGTIRKCDTSLMTTLVCDLP